MGSIYLPAPKDKKLLNLGSPFQFSDIQAMSVSFRNKLLTVSNCLNEHSCPERIDLTDECVAIHLDRASMDAIRASNFSSFIALVGLENGHFTLSLLGADESNQAAPKISSRYKTEPIYGYETWPRRGILGLTKDFYDVLDCK